MVGKLIRQRRTERLLTIEELAGRVGVSPVTLNRIELGHTRPRFSTLRKLAEELGLDPNELSRRAGVTPAATQNAAAAARVESLARLDPANVPVAQESAELVLRRIAADVVGWFAAPDPYLAAHLSSFSKAACGVRGPAADPAQALGVFVASIGNVVDHEAGKRRTAAANRGAQDAYRDPTADLIAKLGRADEAWACAQFRHVSDAYARLLLLASARSFHQGATFYARQRARLMLDDLNWAAGHPDATAAPPKPETRRLVEAFPSVLLAFDAANDSDREEPLLTAEVPAQPLVPA
ncbi:MAG TPA: helix-turn-helix transcriptional regulator [Chloroflexota bacterium]|jgi:transcriptional regulator with XRE-family HTH domain